MDDGGLSYHLTDDVPRLGVPAADADLHNLFCAAFCVDELRRFLATSTLHRLLRELPDGDISISRYSWRLIEQANRHRLFTFPFFDELIQVRPAYRPDIERIREMYVERPHFSQPPNREARQKFSLFLQWRGFKLSIVLSLGVSLISAMTILKWLLVELKENRLEIAEERDFYYPSVTPWSPPSPPASDICDHTDVQEFLKALEGHQCAPGDTSCPAVRLDRSLIEMDQLVSILHLFAPSSLHFPTNKPSITTARPNWPDPLTSEHYHQSLRQRREQFHSAEKILFIGVASPGGNQRQNKLLAQARVNFVEKLVLETQEERDARESLRGKFTAVLFGSQRILSLEGYRALGAAPIAWNPETQDFLNHIKTEQELGPQERRQALNLVNQSVLVVPIPCKSEH